MVSTLARASIDGAILVAAVWVLSRLLRLSPATRTVLWWCAAAKFVVALAWTTPVAIPILPAPAVDDVIVHRGAAGAVPGSDVPPTPASGSRRRQQVQPTFSASFVSALREWSSFAIIGWTLGLVVAALVGVRRWRETVRMLNSSHPAPPEVQAHAIDLASRLRLRRVPDVRMSARVETPLVTGLLRPVVLLPAGRFDTLTGREQQMALCHELAHLERADLWLGCVPALAERVFFFHPLVHLASREYAFSREAACDATVMQTLDAAPQEYGRLLLALGVARPQPGLTAAGAAWSFLNLKRRIAMLQDVSARSTRSRLVAAGAVGLAIAAMVPMQLAARPSGQTLFLTKVAAPAASVSEEQLKAGEPLKPSEIPAKAAQVKEGPPKSGELSFVMLLEDGQRTMSGSPDDVARAERHRRNGEPLLWFRYNGREYVVRDRDLLREARGFWNDVYNSGYGHDAFAAFTDAIKAAKLEKHGKLFEDQLLSADLGAFAEVGKLGAEIGSLAATKAFEALSAAGAGLAQIDEADLERQFLEIEKSKDHIEDHIEEKMRDFEQRFKHDFDHKLQDLEHRLRALEGPIREMTAPLEAWSGHHEAFAASVEKASRKAQEDMRALIERAIAAGLAQTVR